MGYEEEFNIFSHNVQNAARWFYYNISINNHAKDVADYKNLLRDNSQFWISHQESSICYSIVTICKILEEDKKNQSHTIKRLISTAKNSGLFTKDSIRDRITKISKNNQEHIEDSMKTACALSDDDFTNIENFANDIRDKSEPIKKIRHKFLAHQNVFADEDNKKEILNRAECSLIEDTINRLLTIENIFRQARNIGEPPDFKYKNSTIKEKVDQDVKSLLEKLSRGHMQN